MSLIYFDPDYELSLGVTPYDLDNNSIYKDIIEDTIKLVNYQIVFSVENTSSQASNTAKITVFNPPSKFRSALNNNQGKKPTIRLKAGFKEGKSDYIFVGVVEKTKEVREGAENYIEMTCTDGAINIREGVTQRTYPAGTSINAIIEDLADDLSLAYGFIEDVSDITLPNAVSFSGNSAKILEDVTNSIDLKTSIQAGKLYVMKPTLFINTKVATLVSPETGLVGSVSIESNNTDLDTATAKSVYAKEGITFKCLLNGSIRPEGYVEVKSADVDAIYKVTKVRHLGDFEGSEWFSYVTCAGTYTEV